MIVKSFMHPRTVIFTLSLWPAFAGCSSNGALNPANTEAAKGDTAVAVQALQVQATSAQRQVELVGTLEGQQEVTLSSEVSGRVEAIRADLGDRVQRGQVLVELEPTQFRLAVERQQAALTQVLAQLGMKRENETLPEPAETSMVRKAAADLAEAKANYDRARNLLEKGIVSRQVYDTDDARYRVAEANYAASLEQVLNLKAQVKNLSAQLESARKNLSDTKTRAPFDGSVRQRLVEVGQYVKDQTPLISLASTNPLKLRAEVPQHWFPYVQPGAAVEVTVDAYPGEKFYGRVTRVAGSIDPQSRNFAIEARVENAKERLRPGLFARALLTTSRADSIVSVPAGAVVSFYGVQKVYVIENQEIRERVVKLGDRFGDTIEVTEGLPPGSWIATSELSRIRQGSRVQVQGKKES